MAPELAYGQHPKVFSAQGGSLIVWKASFEVLID